MNILLVFLILTIINVVFSTVKSIITIKGSPLAAAIANAAYYGYYNVVVIYTVADFSLFWKVTITFGCNLLGVWFVKWLENKAKKDKIWLVKVTVPVENGTNAKELFSKNGISFTCYVLDKYYVFDTYCETKNETKKVTEICYVCNGKSFATENKLNF